MVNLRTFPLFLDYIFGCYFSLDKSVLHFIKQTNLNFYMKHFKFNAKQKKKITVIMFAYFGASLRNIYQS